MSDDPPMPDQVDDLVSSFRSARPTYEAFVDNVGTLLGNLLRSENVEHLPIEKRTKSIESYRAKLTRPEKEEKYQALADITDLAGIRIVAYYESDVDRICSIIESNFSVDAANSSDKMSIIDPDRFGYLSKHFVVSHGERRRDLPENIQFAGLKAEIQIRTVVQHAWAVIDRRLRYNNEADIPRELRRKLFRISALLELADKEFSEVDAAITALRVQYEAGVRSGDLEIEINRDSVEVFVESSSTVKRLRSMAESHGMEVNDSDAGLTQLVQTISAAGLRSIQQVDELLRSEADLNAKLLHFVKLRGAERKMSAPALVRVCILLTLPRSKANETLAVIPFLTPRYNEFIRLVHEDSEAKKGSKTKRS
jgi:putative GTP pyrophosphokinase